MTDTGTTFIAPYQLEELRKIANEWSCELVLDGQVGFGRDCVGIKRGDKYIDFLKWSWEYEDKESQRVLQLINAEKPDLAYHKHDCLCVLGKGAESQLQLYLWVKDLYDKGFTVIELPPVDLGSGSISLDELIYGRKLPVPTLALKVGPQL